MLSRLSVTDWLWKGSFEVDAQPLAAWAEEIRPDRNADLLAPVAATLAELWRLIDLSREIEKSAQSSPGDSAEMRSLAKSMLPVLDALDRVVEFARKSNDQSPEFRNWTTAVDGVALRLTKSLERIGLTPLSTVGTEVDLAIHDVVGTIPSREYPENTVVKEQQKGYYFKGKLLRDAKVVVALSPPMKGL